MKVKIGKYQHFKGGEYEVIGLARNSETLEELVVYKALYHSNDFDDDILWVRPKKMFLENVIKDGKSVPRFKLIDQK